MTIKESTPEFLMAVLAELSEDDAAGMFTFLTALIKSSPGKLRKIANNFKDPKVQAEFQKVMTTENKLTKMTRGAALVQKIFG